MHPLVALLAPNVVVRSPSDPTNVVWRLVDEVINGGRLDVIGEIYAPQMAPRGRTDGSSHSGEASPTVRMDIVDLIAEGEKVVGRFRCSATTSASGEASAHRPPLRARRRGLQPARSRRPHHRGLGHRGHATTRAPARLLHRPHDATAEPNTVS
jgi:hypothetical protein